MARKLFALALLSLAAVLLLSLSSCARSQTLTAISVTPQGSTVVLNAYGQQVGTQFTAYGIYIHPAEQRDITKSATWATDTPSVIQAVSGTPGLFNTTGTGCGTNLGISATVYTDNNNMSGNVMVGTSTITVSFSKSSNVTCP